ncbi:lon protease homolog 1, mitochondrial-like [Rutidosis leptorrhynchoides]|uniref:lon protease homolog 1, mitochondrial-like n=1 Tax=Rutidosis leptorrhynchoides TaxID=125765 RepID=UPI003A98D5BD
MLKALRSSPRVLRPVLGLTNPSLLQTRFSSSDSSDGPGSECVPAVEETQSKSAAPVAATVMRVPLEIAKVLALPLAHKPLFPGSYIPTYVKDAKLLAALSENLKGEVPYVGAFLVKADPRSELSGLNIEKKIYEFKGKDLFNRLHEVGTLAQIIPIQGDEVVLMGHKRLRITEMVSEDPLTVKVDHLKNSAYNMDDDVIKATYFEVVKILKDIMKTHPSWRDLVEHIGDLNYPRVADFAATVSFLDKLQCQQVLEELDVYKRVDTKSGAIGERNGDI